MEFPFGVEAIVVRVWAHCFGRIDVGCLRRDGLYAHLRVRLFNAVAALTNGFS